MQNPPYVIYDIKINKLKYKRAIPKTAVNVSPDLFRA